MDSSSGRPPSLFIAACTMLSAGVVFLILTLILVLDGHVFRGFIYISLALIAFGTGEIINHPKESLPLPEKNMLPSAPHLPRKRNASSLGNLCDIFSLLLFFTGIAALIYGR
ncbi:MAG: hypothetical protein ACWGOX_09160 [Desulforhopalus sp.]